MADRAVPIGDYQSQIPVQEGLRRIVPEVRPSQIGSGVQGLAQQAQDTLRHIQESDAAAQSAQALSTAQMQFHQHLQDSMQSAGPGAPDFTKNFMADFDKYATQAIQNTSTPVAKEFMTDWQALKIISDVAEHNQRKP